MNKFIKNLFYEKGSMIRQAKSPLMMKFQFEEHMYSSPLKLQDQYIFKLKFDKEVWVDANAQNKDFVLRELRELIAKRLHQEIFGDIEGYFHELQLHLHNEDYESSKSTVELIKAAIKGN